MPGINYFKPLFFAIKFEMRTRVIVHLDRFIRNFNAVKKRTGTAGGARICVPVKADAYVHGALEIAKTSLEAGAYCLGVATVTEGAELRKGGIKAPILLFSQPHPDEIPHLIKAELTPFISDERFAGTLNKQAETAKARVQVHIKIDTGMGRTGCSVEEAAGLARFINTCPDLKLAGTATHFPVSDSTDAQDIEYTKTQIARFKEAVDEIRASGIDPGIVHAANSGGVILHPDSWFDMVRPGIFLYGYKTAEESRIPGFPFEPLKAEPVMELRACVMLIKKINKGQSDSYGRTWTAQEDTNIAILSAGYADGFPRLASGKWQVVINGNAYPVAGRICMDLCCVDLGPDNDVKRWDEAVIFGGGAPDAAELADRIGTIPYEITCNACRRTPREYCH
jgi:alanine racemase